MPENRHNELPVSILVRRIELFELIEHSVNFSLSGTFRTHFRYFEFEACGRGFESGQSGAYHGAAYTASEPETSRLCGRDQGPRKERPLPRGKLTSLRSKAPRPMPRSGL